MKKYISSFLLTILLFVLQTTLFEHISFAGVVPNLLIIITSVYGYLYGRNEGMFTGVIAGLLMDILYGNVIGVRVIIFCVIGYINGATRNLYFKRDITVPVLILAVSDFAYNILYYVCYYLMRGRIDLLGYFRQIIILEVFYTILIGIPVFYLMNRFFKTKTKYPIDIKSYEEEKNKAD